MDYNGLSVVFSGDTKPTMTLVEAAEGCDLLIHETFLPAATFAEINSMPLEKAQFIVNEAHTPPKAAGVVFDMVQPRMAGMWHCQVLDGYVDPVFEELQERYQGPVTLCQDLTVFNVTPDAVVTRQAQVNDAPLAVAGDSKTPLTMDKSHPRPDWWEEAAIKVD